MSPTAAAVPYLTLVPRLCSSSSACAVSKHPGLCSSGPAQGQLHRSGTPLFLTSVLGTSQAGGAQPEPGGSSQDSSAPWLCLWRSLIAGSKGA